MNDTSDYLYRIISSPSSELDFFHLGQHNFTVGMVVCVPVLQVLPIGHHAGRAVLLGPLCRGREPLALDVGLYPKVGEEEKEEDTVDPNEVDPEANLVVTLFHEVVLADVNRDYNKLCLKEEESVGMLQKYRGNLFKLLY